VALTRDDLSAALTDLAAIERLLAERIALVRIVIDPQGRELYRVHRGFFQPRGEQ
jgi:hypothetical protein